MVQHYAAQRRKQALLARYASVLVASRHMHREYARQGIEAVVVPLPLDERHRGERSIDRGTEEWNLLYLGRLERAKGVDVALRAGAIAAARASRPVRLTIAGQGPFGSVVKAQAEAAASAGRGRLTIDVRGWLTAAERDRSLARADLLLVPSLWPEPFGLVGIEAAAAGVPAVAFGVGGIEDWLQDGVTGRLVPPADGDRDARFAAAILSVLHDPVALGAMRTAAADRARQFTMAAHMGALDPVLHAAAETSRRRRRA
jgi:glycosyltransferase involved in cell wall biosynthesis